MKERGTPFKAPQVRAILDGRKTQHRWIIDHLAGFGRITEFGPSDTAGYDWHFRDKAMRWHDIDHARLLQCCPYGSPAQKEYRPIPSTGGVYLAGSDGGIYRNGKRLSPWRGGYECNYEMVAAGDQRKAYVHRLVCEAFYGPAPEGLPEVRHLDGKSLNNRPDNLDWGTKEQNAADRSAHGKVTQEAHHASRLSACDVAEIRSLRGSVTRPALAIRFSVSVKTIDDVIDGKTWIERIAPPANLPRYQQQPGDRLWVRESMLYESYGEVHFFPADRKTVPQATEQRLPLKSIPSIHMPRWASRINLEITGVRVERLRDISEADCYAEGIQIPCDADGHPLLCLTGKFPTSRYIENPRKATMRDLARAEYASLIESINGAGTWDANQRVRVVEFRRLP